MKKIFLFLFLFFLTSPTYAQWVLIGESEDLFIYVDPTTVKKNKHIVKMWEVLNYKVPIAGINSVRALAEYDCNDETTKILATFGYSEMFGKGKIIASNNESSSSYPIPPDSTPKLAWDVACRK